MTDNPYTTAFGWLLEEKASPVSRPRYWCGHGKRGHKWTGVAEKAVRFSRKTDAARVANILMFSMVNNSEPVRVCEHGWG